MITQFRSRMLCGHASRTGKGWLRTAHSLRFALALVLAGALVPAIAGAAVVTIPASKDNTLYQDNSGAVSNGATVDLVV